MPVMSADTMIFIALEAYAVLSVAGLLAVVLRLAAPGPTAE